jgi:nucleoid-associated protein YejK
VQLEFVIVHNIEKKPKKVGARLEKSDEVLDITDPQVINLVTELNDRYRTKNQSYGTFDPKAYSVEVQNEVADFLKTPNEKNFITFSQNTVDRDVA